VQKSAAILGLGYQSVIPVATNDHFQMDVATLTQTIKQTLDQGLLPIAVVATVGTTDFGSIDPLLSIAQLCQQHDLWLHVDAAYGCGLLTIEKYRPKLNGIELADSVTVDYHKSFFQPVSCGAFFVKHKSRLNYVTHHADYLNPLSQKQEGVPNLVNKSIQTTRRFDALKLWLTLRTMGPERLGDYFEQVIRLTKQLYCQLSDDPTFELIHAPELSTLVFRYRPKTAVLSCSINQAIRTQLRKSGEAMIASTKVKGKTFLKITLLNPTTRIEQIMRVFDRIKQIGKLAEA
jgi:L-2,4-diaminobutyrate decarboxylase